MHIIFLTLTLAHLCICAPKSPRIYNVLISTKKNLAPSQALPVYEPVLRTTSLGLAFSPFVYTPIGTLQNSPARYVSSVHQGPAVQDIINTENQSLERGKEPAEGNGNYVQTKSASSGGVKNLPENVVPLQRYVPYYTAPQLAYEPYYSKPQQKLVDKIPIKNLEEVYENVNDPKQTIANLKKNSDIPDVPPPPLPVRNL